MTNDHTDRPIEMVATVKESLTVEPVGEMLEGRTCKPLYTALREAAEMALNALDSINSPLQVREIVKVGKAKNALRTALEQKANIRLISAAPDLLNVLREVRAIWSEDEFQLGTVDRIHSAIAKATGEQMTALREAELDEPCFCDRKV